MGRNIKYFQALWDMKEHYEDIIWRYENKGEINLMLLDTWGIKAEDMDHIVEENEALRYLVGLRLDWVQDTNAQKPSQEVVSRLFNRHLQFIETIHQCHQYNVNKHGNSLVRKQYKTCRYYLFKFSYQSFYDKLPDEILTFDNKYGSMMD